MRLFLMQVKNMFKNVKAQTQVFMGLIIGLGVLAFGFAVIMALTQGVYDQQTANSYAANGTRTILEALATIPGWVKLLVLAVVGLALVGVVMLFNRIRS